MGRHSSLRERCFCLVRLLCVAGATVFLLLGCSGESPVNSLLRIDDEQQIQEATDRGKKLWGSDPYSVFRKTTQEVNIRIDPDVILRSAALCLPADELAFTVASLPSGSADTVVKQTVDDAVVRINQQVKFIVTLQLTKTFDPAKVDFELKTNGEQSYPVAAVPKPVLIQDIPASIDGDIPAAALYGYEVYFQSSGSPGYPPIDSTVSGLTLLVKSGGVTSDVSFPLYSGTKR